MADFTVVVGAEVDAICLQALLAGGISCHAGFRQLVVGQLLCEGIEISLAVLGASQGRLGCARAALVHHDQVALFEDLSVRSQAHAHLSRTGPARSACQVNQRIGGGVGVVGLDHRHLNVDGIGFWIAAVLGHAQHAAFHFIAGWQPEGAVTRCIAGGWARYLGRGAARQRQEDGAAASKKTKFN